MTKLASTLTTDCFQNCATRIANAVRNTTILLCCAFMVISGQTARATDEPTETTSPPSLIETSTLQADVAAGRLPAVSDRVPSDPRVVDLVAMGREPGRHGGRMRWLMASEKDIRMAFYYGYSRLVGYNEYLKLVPDILAAVEVEEERRFTLKLRRGHRWSDGHPFTSEDFRYWWEDVAHDKKLDNGVLAPELLVAGEPPQITFLDAYTVRYEWTQPNPSFLPALARPMPITLMMPAHFLKQFHAKYSSKEKLAKLLEKHLVRSWPSLHRRMSRIARPLEPDMPTLDPWRNTTPPPSSILRLDRNPYFHRIDANGRQLPYIDGIDLMVGSSSLVPVKTGAGDSDLQARYIDFNDYTYLKAAERRGAINVKLWDLGSGSQVALMPNLTTSDTVWRDLLLKVEVRRALSIAINRAEINAAIYFGLARPSADTVLPLSPLYREEYVKAWIQYDPQEANRLLDGAGLEKRSFDGYRLLPDGRRAEIIVESAGESSEHAEVLALVKDHYRAIGIAIYTRPTQRDLFRKRIYSGQTVMSVWFGKDNATPTPDMSPARYAPVAQDQVQWSDWGLYYETHGKKGVQPSLPAARQLVALVKQWKRTVTTDERARIWHEILAINADQVFSIGIVNGARQPVVTNPHMRNVPERAIFSFEPGSFFGIHMPDTFWLDLPKRAASAKGQ